MPTPLRILVVYHSLTGGTRQMAEAAARGAASAGDDVQVELLPAAGAGAAHLLAADGYIFATPENLAAMAGQMKDFFDRTYYAGLDRLNGRPFLLLVCAGSDGRSAVAQVERIATGWRLKPVAESFIARTGATTPEQILAPKQMAAVVLRRCEELGATLANGLQLGIF